MAESAVFHLLSNFAPLLQEEVNLLGGVREGIEYIRGEFERMVAFLRVADAMEEKDPELKVWVKQVREAAYDTEDVLDKFMLRLGHHHGDGVRGFLRKVSCFIKTLKARHQIASEVQRIKSRVVDISNGHQRYHDRYGIPEKGSRSINAFNNVWYDSRGDALLIEEAELVGIEKPKSELIGWLAQEDPRLKVFSVVGMGGLGKTTLVKKVFEDEGVKKHFQNHAWITVSESFKIEELLKGMIQQLFEEAKQPVPQGVETMDTNGLKGLINAFLQQKRYVLVFDDVWDIHSWQAFRYAFPDCNCGSRVLLTTRNVDLASFSSKEYHGNVYNLQPLPPRESWTLFCRKTFQETTCPSYLEGISTGILKRCEGLPLAIVAISGLLSTKEKSSVDEWDRIYSSLGAELEGNDKLLSINKILSLSYIDLPYSLKYCFLYLSIFPEDCLIDHWRLIRLWVAEGFVEVRQGMTAEEVAELYLNELISRSLIQVAATRNGGRVRAYRIHDLWREIIGSMSMEQNFVTIASHEQQTRWPDKVRRLSIHSGLENLEPRKRFTRLRSLLEFSAVADSLSKFSMLASLNEGLRLLKVLDLRGMPLETFPDEVANLFHLRYLSLRGTKVKMLPNSIGKLQNLETLDLKHTYVTELPVEVLRLKKLCHLLLYRYETGSLYAPFHAVDGFTAPYEIGSLQFLQKLCFLEADQIVGGSTSVVKELGRLTQLRRLAILKLRREDGKALCSSIEKLTKLRSLYVTSIEEDEILDVQSLSSTPRLLQRLCLKGRLEKLPQWITSLNSVVRVYLRWNKLRDDPMQALQDLPNLVELELLQAYEGEELCFKAGGFQMLKFLWLSRLKGLKRLRLEEGTMPRLEQLGITNCELVEEVPSGIQHLTTLKYLKFHDMSNKLISKLDWKVGGGDYWKIAHIPKVWVANSKHGYWQGKYL